MFPKYEYRNTSVYLSARKSIAACPARFHNHLEIFAVTDGQVEVSVHGQDYTLHAGDLYIAFPNVLHAIQDAKAQAVVVVADPQICGSLQDLMMRNIPREHVLRKDALPPTVHAMICRLGELADADHPYRQSVLGGYINALLGELIARLELIDRNVDGSLLQQLILFFLENYTRNITLDDAAQALCYSKFHISRMISQAFGCNFRTLINTYRVSMAENLLVTGTDSIGTIAEKCGFQNQSSFNRIFLKHVGISPRDYRRKMGPPPEKPVLYIR